MDKATAPLTVQVAIVGGGPAGLTAAIALSSAGVETALVSRAAEPDSRTTALLAGSVTALNTLGVWSHCMPHAAPLRTMRIADSTSRLIRAPEVSFAAAEIGLDAFGHNIENRHLLAALVSCAARERSLMRIEGDVLAVEPRADHVIVRLAGDRQLRAKLVIGADGRRSRCRAAAGIEASVARYEQTALTFNLRHTRPHHDTSTEFHTEHGPFTLVPLPGQRSSLVCVTSPDDADDLAHMNDAALAAELERRSHSILGKLTVDPGRGAFPLAVETARRFADRRILLIGEAAHAMPPIGAQGLNLGLRDAATAGEMAMEALRAGADPGGAALLKRYDAARRADVGSRTLAVDLINRSLLTDFLPVQGARGLGLYLLDRIGPLRRAAMREGVGPSLSQPRLMRGEAL
jgi:2-octaprenyl-6-methoxyphenol hydroxylase